MLNSPLGWFTRDGITALSIDHVDTVSSIKCKSAGSVPHSLLLEPLSTRMISSASVRRHWTEPKRGREDGGKRGHQTASIRESSTSLQSTSKNTHTTPSANLRMKKLRESSQFLASFF